MNDKPRFAVISPLINKSQGTERCVAELIERLASDCEIHLYSTTAEDVELSRITWHRIPRLPGPHLTGYLFFFLANQLQRLWDRLFKRLDFDLVFSPGINCFNSDVIWVHIVFAVFRERMKEYLDLRKTPLWFWPRLIHRRLSYGCFAALERIIYKNENSVLVAPSQRVANELALTFGRANNLFVVYHGADSRKFSAERREQSRGEARRALQLSEEDFVLLLIGNDWKNKGLLCLAEAVRKVQEPHLRLIAVGDDDPAHYRLPLNRGHLPAQVRFLPCRPDVEFYYAAADAYVGPSMEDAFGLPPLEAMACGLPVIVSRRAGVSELITHGVDGFILEDPTDSEQLAELIRRIYQDVRLRQRLGAQAAETALRYTWERNYEGMKEVFDRCLKEKFRNDPVNEFR